MEGRAMPRVGYRVKAKVISVKGTCTVGHKAGDAFYLSGHDTAGLCGFSCHDVFPYVVMLQFGGGFPADWGNPDVVEFGCMDRTNAVTLRLTRVFD
jgi:uncharacterized repeat protein (TIGR04076 family)